MSKRTAEDLSSPPPKIARTGDSDNEHPEPTSSLPPSSLLLTSLASSQVDRSRGEIDVSEKSQWRYFSDPIDFYKFAEWDAGCIDNFVSDFQSSDTTLTEYLVESAFPDLLSIRRWTMEGTDIQQIRWGSLPLDHGIVPGVILTEASENDLVFTWIQVKKLTFFIHKRHKEQYLNFLIRLLPPTSKGPVNASWDIMERAFHRTEKMTTDRRRPSETLYQKILEYYQEYNVNNHMEPYTSIVGPSGVGKSFTIGQLALEHGLYVSYSSLGAQGYRGYPRRSVIADHIPLDIPRPLMEAFWECYIIICLTEVENCKNAGITPAGFFNLQVMEMYQKYQGEFSSNVQAFFRLYQANGVQKRKESPKFERMRDFLKRDVTTNFLQEYDHGSRSSLVRWHVFLEENSHNPQVAVSIGSTKRTPNALICIDEAKSLLDKVDSLLFRSFRIAARERFHRTSQAKATQQFSHPPGDFFAVLLDTTSKIANFSPPSRHDPSQKMVLVEWGTLFPPIYTIDTMDIFVRKDDTLLQDGSEEAVCQLFRCGRPLWGGRLDSGGALDEVLLLAQQKTQGKGGSHALALLSYRLNFYVLHHALAEELVTGWLRYIVYVNPARDLIRTIQPSEPILAYTAAMKMLEPGTRLRVVQQFVRASFEGSVNIGDIGEMASALLLLFSYDEVQFDEPFALPSPIKLEDWMGSLFGQKSKTNIKERMETDPDMKRLWQEGLIFFNHFFKLQETPSRNTLELAFERGAAMFLPDRFPGADILVPIRLSASEMTFCIIQVQNRKNDHLTSGLRNQTVSSLQSAVAAMGISANHLGIMMCLRSEGSDTSQNFEILAPPISHARNTRQTLSNQANKYRWPNQQKKLVVAALGLDAQLYPFVNQCRGTRTAESEAIVPLMQQLLDCIPGISLPEDADKSYVRRLMPLSCASAVLDLLPSNFEKEVIKSGVPTLVEFFAPWCGHCKNLAPVYEELAQTFAFASNMVQIAKVDADAHKDLGKKYGLQEFPTLKFFDGKSEDPIEYSGGRDLESLSSFIKEKTGIQGS